MLNLFRKPLNKDSLDSWCKILDDVAKVAILAVPVVLYNDKPISYRIANGVSLAICAYFSLYSADMLRKNKDKLTQPKE